jgi:hypothetical protein
VILPWQNTGESLDCGLGYDLERLKALGHHHRAIRTPEIQKILESEKIGVGACRGSEIVNFYAKLACERPCRRFPAKLVCERPVSQISDLLVLFERC